MISLESFFDAAIEAKASDIHLVGGEVPTMRISGQLQTLSRDRLDPEELQSALLSLFTEKQRAQFDEIKDVDLGHTYNGTRFRINVHQQDGRIALAGRRIPQTIPTAEELGFEPVLRQFTTLPDGLVLVVGPTGHGKSTTIASLINEINHSRRAHIVTVEDPIEFAFADDQSLVEQRQIGTDTVSFASALKHVLRQDPDVIFIGEMRDPETIATALTAAETGHLVFSTLHTSSAPEAIERIVDVFDGSKQRQVLIQLSAVLRGIVAQQLIPTVNGSLMAVREILINTPAVANLIRENNISQIASAMQTGSKFGMVTMDHALDALVAQGIVSEEVATLRRQFARQRA